MLNLRRTLTLIRQFALRFLNLYAGTFRSRCCYAADYAYFDPIPEAYQPWEGKHSHVTFFSPSPEKGLSIFLRIAESLPDVQFLAVKTVAWTKPWHEQILKRLKNVTIQSAGDKIEDILSITKVAGLRLGWSGTFTSMMDQYGSNGFLRWNCPMYSYVGLCSEDVLEYFRGWSVRCHFDSSSRRANPPWKP